MPPLVSSTDQSTPASRGFVTSPSLLVRACDKDAEAWRRIVQLYAPLLRYWCRQASLTQDDSDEIIQDVFLSVSKQLERFRYDRPTDTFRGWLRQITKRRIADRFRSTVDQPFDATGGTTAFQRIYETPDSLADDPDAEAEEAGVALRALEFISSEFESKTLEAFRRTAIEGQRPVDVATELQMSPSAVRMAKARVLSRLRQELDGLGLNVRL